MNTHPEPILMNLHSDQIGMNQPSEQTGGINPPEQVGVVNQHSESNMMGLLSDTMSINQQCLSMHQLPGSVTSKCRCVYAMCTLTLYLCG